MGSDPPDRPRVTAVQQLEALGLSAYAARTFVALVGLGEGTAQDVSEVADVPRTRVYDAAEELREMFAWQLDVPDPRHSRDCFAGTVPATPGTVCRSTLVRSVLY